MPAGSFLKVFGGATIRPAEVSYSGYALAADTTFSWPIEASATLPLLSRIMDVTPSGAGLSITLPNATLVGVGETVLFTNLGADTYTIKDAAGVALCTVAAGAAWQIWLRTNSTAAGTWGIFQYGAQASSSNVAAMAGYGIKAIGPTLNQSMPVGLLSTDYTVGTPDRAKGLVWTGGSGTLTFPLVSTLGSDFFINVHHAGSGTWTIAPTAPALIDGNANLTLDEGDSAIIFTDGTNFYTVGYHSPAASDQFDLLTINLAGLSGTYTLTGSELDRVGYKFIGALAGAVAIVVPNTIDQYWVDNQTTGFGFTVKTAAQVSPITVASGDRRILYCDATDVVIADTVTGGISTPVSIANGGTGANTAGTARTNLGSTAIGDALFTTASAANARSTISAISDEEAQAYAIIL